MSINQFPIIAMKNKRMLQMCQNAGCFHCLNLFQISEIKDYTDNGETAICPKCQIDSVVGDQCGFVLNEQILKNANNFWYKKK